MGYEGAYQSELLCYRPVKVHSLMCSELASFIYRISQIYSEIESSRPRCTSGLQALCSLHAAIDRSKLLIQHCSDCSKLYLAFTSDRILSTCENIRKSLDLCLGQIQNLVPTMLAAKISGIIEELRCAKFILESSEAEAGKVVKELLMLDMPASESKNDAELEALQFAAVRLKLTSPLAVLIEKRSIKRLHRKVRLEGSKKQILEYFLNVLRKYGEQIGQDTADVGLALQDKCKTRTENSAAPEPPLEFKCPISKRLMYDPVIIASGKTFERVWIEKWLQEGNNECPETHMKLENFYLTPNLMMKELITKWCSDHGITVSEPRPAPVYLQKFLSFRSIASIGSSVNDLSLQVSNVSLRSSDTNLDGDSSDDENNDDIGSELPQKNADACISHTSMKDPSISFTSLSKLDSLPWESQYEAVQEIKEKLNGNEELFDWALNNSFIKQVIKFLINANDVSHAKAQDDSAYILRSILSKSRIELPAFDKDSIYMLASLLDSEICGKALAILEELSWQRFYKCRILESGVLPAILKVLESHIREFRKLAMKIIFNLSYNSIIAYHIVYLDCMPKLVPFLADKTLARCCLGIMNALCGIEEGRAAIADTDSCISLIATLVERGTEQEQETALEVLHSLYYDHAELCQQVIGDSIVQSLFYISVNTNSRRKDTAKELLQLMGHTTEADVSDGSGLSIGISSDSGNHPKGTKSSSKKFAYLGKIISKLFHQV